MRMKNHRKQINPGGHRHSFLTIVLILCLLLNSTGLNFIPVYAAQDSPSPIDVGGGVSAVLQEGVLTLSGEGRTDDYSTETAPFLPYAGEVHTLVIENGVTYIGAYLFYGLGELGGELTLPGSITGFGDYAFAGEQLESAPKFTGIKNEFESAEIEDPVQSDGELEPDLPENGSDTALEGNNSETEVTVPSEEVVPPEDVDDGSAGDLILPEDNAEEYKESSPEDSEGEKLSGETANYTISDEQSLPKEDAGEEVTQETASQESASQEAVSQEPVLRQKDAVLSGQPADNIRTKVIMQQEIDHPETLFVTGQDGYVICRNENTTFAESARAAGYRVSDTAENEEQKDPEEKESLLTETPEPAALYSKAAVAAEEVYCVYVNQESGDDNKDGTESLPFKSLTKAAKYLMEKNLNGTVETNKIILQADYDMDQADDSTEKSGGILGGTPMNVTICGSTQQIRLKGSGEDKDNIEKAIDLSGNLKLESLTLATLQHIYGSGHDIILGKDVTSKGTYLYGSYRTPISTQNVKVGKIEVESGGIARIVGYIRSFNTNVLNVNNQEANITVGGNAIVSTIVAGSASGGIENANVNINIEGGTVTTVIGGNQGFTAVKSPYSGTTKIEVSGGNVGDIYGAGTGRNASIPTYLGNLDIKVSGGKVKNIYGAGSAAFVKSEEDTMSSVRISAQGGTIGNIYAAGKGNENGVSLYKDESTNYTFAEETTPEKFGSLTGSASITVGGSAIVEENIYASGSGDSGTITGYDGDGLKSNAYLKGTAEITVNGGTINGSIYGGGKGIAQSGYEECARVDTGSTVKIAIAGGEVKGSVFGGGENGKVNGNTDVTISGGIVSGNVYGGSKNAVVEGKTNVTITNGTIENSVYGGSLGSPGSSLVLGGATVNMTGGWVKKNLYGGSEKSDDGVVESGSTKDMIFVNLTGGTVTKNVFGGGYLGTVYGSTHVHIGIHAPDKCTYYNNHAVEKPQLTSSKLLVEGSVYAGGDFGGGADYNAITITGTSHVYIDGTGYNTGTGSTEEPDLTISGGVFGSGASCDAGSTRLVTLDHYGVLDESADKTNTTRTLEAIQRADRVLLIESHVRLKGKSDIANNNTTALYSLNRIGDHSNPDVGTLGKGLVLKGGSTVILDSEAIGLGRFSSRDKEDGIVGLDKVRNTDGMTSNKVCFDSGTVFRVAVENTDKSLEYGEVSGYAYMEAGETAEVFAYARTKTEEKNKNDGGFVDPRKTDEEIPYYNVGSTYRYWQMKKDAGAVSERETVLTAQELKAGDSGYIDGTYSVAEGTIELPHASEPTVYTIEQVSLVDASGMTLVEAAKSGMGNDDEWFTSQTNQESGESITQEQEKKLIQDNPLSHFGLFMKAGEGFSSGTGKEGKVVSEKSIIANDKNTIIKTSTAETQKNIMPQIKFYLTYSNKGITVSKKLGAVVIQIQGKDSSGKITTINMKVEIITKAAALSDQTIDLYATQSGSYTGKLTIPSGVSRTLHLQKVTSGNSERFISYDAPTITGQQFGISMQQVQSSGWTEAAVTKPYDLKSFTSGQVNIGTTDSRYEAIIEFNLKNAPGFTDQESPDTVLLEFADQAGQVTKITLHIYWKPSVVSKVQLSAGRHYNQIVKEENSPSISSKSAVTTQFTLGTQVQINDLWLELRNIENGDTKIFPPGTSLTLITSAEFYIYTVSGSEAQGRIRLSDFKSMWDDTAFTGTTAAGAVWDIIVDFSTGTSGLSPGNYGLRLREDKSADSQDDYFTVNNSIPVVTIANAPTSGLSRGEYQFTLSASASGDTRFNGSVWAVLAPEGGTEFPMGTVIQYEEGGEMFSLYPRGGKTYLPMPESGSRVFTMSTMDTTGLKPGQIGLKAAIMPGGVSAGASWESVGGSLTPITVTANPETALSIALLGDGTRVVKAGDKLQFKADYLNGMNESAIKVGVQKKSGEAYIDAAAEWIVTGNTETAGAGTKTIDVTVADSSAAGTYRILFTLGDKEVPYNVIVE